MQTLTITFQIPDGVQVHVSGNATIPASSAAIAPVITAPVATTEAAKPSGPTLEDVKTAFKAAVFKNGGGEAQKQAAFAALGCSKVADVPEVMYADVIEKLNAYAKSP